MLNIKAFIEDVLNFKSCCNQERDKNIEVILVNPKDIFMKTI